MAYTEFKSNLDMKEVQGFVHIINFGTPEQQQDMIKTVATTLKITDNEKTLKQLTELPNDAARLNFISELLTEKLKNDDQKLAENASYIFSSIENDTKALNTALESIRGLVFNANKVTANGLCCDNNGEPAEDSFYNPLPGKTVAEWGVIRYLDGTTGLLSENSTTGSKAMRVMYVMVQPGDTKIMVTHIDVHKVRAGIKQDLKFNPTMLPRYAAGSGQNKTTGDDTGVTGQFRSTIAEAAAVSPYPEYSQSSMLAEMIRQGHIQCAQHLMIGTLEVLRHFDDAALQKLSEKDVQRYLDIIYNFVTVDDAKQKANVSDSCLDSYLDDTGAPLNGMDDKGNIITGNVNTHETKRRYLVWLGQQVITNLQKTLVMNNTSAHPLKQDIINAYTQAICK